MPDVYFTASFGDVPMHVASLSTQRGRDVAVQSPTSGDKHTLSDRGRRMVSSTWELLFVDRPGLPSYLERYDAFVALVELGEAQVLSHPLDGTYLARAADVQVSADSSSLEVRVTCTFHREERPTAVLSVVPGTTSYTGVESLAAIADLSDASLAAAGVSSTVPAEAAAEIAAWSETDDLDTNEVALGVSALTQRIDAAMLELELATNLDRWPAYRHMVQLRYAVVRAGEAFTSASAATTEILVDRARPLRAIVAELYGARGTEEYVATIIAMNRLRTPARVPAGTALLVPLRGVG